jgi:hypothetical protein
MTTVLPTSLPDLVAFWDFQEPAGQARLAHGRPELALREGNGPVERADTGIFGPHAAQIRRGQWLSLPRAAIAELDIHGPAAQVSVVAWVQRHGPWSPECEAVAGLWNETRASRQYCLFLNLRIYESRDQVCGHISAVGGPTPGERYCMDAAIGATPVPVERWQCIAFTYDGQAARAYLQGCLDARAGRNPYPYPGGIFDGGPAGADFTVGAVHRGGEMGNFFAGLLGGLAIYRRALRPEELHALAAPTL